MSSTNTKTSLDTMFKRKLADEVNNLVPSHAIIQKRLGKLTGATTTGRNFTQPVALTLENGVTYGDGTAFAYNDDIAGVYEEIEMDSNPIVLKSRVSISAANRMANSESSFISEMSLRSGNMKESLMKRYEIEILHGKVGLGKISGDPSVNTSPTPDQATIIFSDETWCPAIWGGMEGCKLEVRNGSSLINQNGDLTLVSTDIPNKSIIVSGDNTDLTNLATGYDVYFKGQYANGFHGLHYQISNSGTLFGIDAATYSLWSGTTVAVGGALTMRKVLKGIALAVGKAGLASDVVLVVAPLVYESLNADIAGLRMFDSSYKSEAENGFDGISYKAQCGKVTILSHPYQKDGLGFLYPEKNLLKVGATDIQFGFGGDDYFEKLEGNAGYQLLVQGDWCVLMDKPGWCVLFTGITSTL